MIARYVTGNDRGEQFAKLLVEALSANGIAANASGGLVEEIMENITKQGRPWASASVNIITPRWRRL